MLRFIGGFIVLAVVCILIAASTQPTDFRVERSIIINAPPAKVAALINDAEAQAKIPLSKSAKGYTLIKSISAKQRPRR